MHVGDKYHLVFGGDLAFGQKGRPSGDDVYVIMCSKVMMHRWKRRIGVEANHYIV